MTATHDAAHTAAHHHQHHRVVLGGLNTSYDTDSFVGGKDKFDSVRKTLSRTRRSFAYYFPHIHHQQVPHESRHPVMHLSDRGTDASLRERDNGEPTDVDLSRVKRNVIYSPSLRSSPGASPGVSPGASPGASFYSFLRSSGASGDARLSGGRDRNSDRNDDRNGDSSSVDPFAPAIVLATMATSGSNPPNSPKMTILRRGRREAPIEPVVSADPFVRDFGLVSTPFAKLVQARRSRRNIINVWPASRESLFSLRLHKEFIDDESQPLQSPPLQQVLHSFHRSRRSVSDAKPSPRSSEASASSSVESRSSLHADSLTPRVSTPRVSSETTTLSSTSVPSASVSSLSVGPSDSGKSVLSIFRRRMSRNLPLSDNDVTITRNPSLFAESLMFQYCMSARIGSDRLFCEGPTFSFYAEPYNVSSTNVTADTRIALSGIYMYLSRVIYPLLDFLPTVRSNDGLDHLYNLEIVFCRDHLDFLNELLDPSIIDFCPHLAGLIADLIEVRMDANVYASVAQFDDTFRTSSVDFLCVRRVRLCGGFGSWMLRTGVLVVDSQSYLFRPSNFVGPVLRCYEDEDRCGRLRRFLNSDRSNVLHPFSFERVPRDKLSIEDAV